MQFRFQAGDTELELIFDVRIMMERSNLLVARRPIINLWNTLMINPRC